MSNANRSPASNILQINRPVTYIAAQRTGTCFTDAIETILCFSDGIRHIFLEPFQAWLTPERAKDLTEFNPEYQAFIREKYNNSDYARSTLIRYLQRQTLEVKPMLPEVPGTWLRRMPSRNATRGNASRREYEKNIKNSGSCSKGLPVLRSLIPGIQIFDSKPPLRTDWATTLVGALCSVWWVDRVYHAFAFIRNHNRWYFCEGSFGYAFEVNPKFNEHLINSLVLQKKIEWSKNPASGVVLIVAGVPLTFLVNGEEISVIPMKSLPERVKILPSTLAASTKVLFEELGDPYPESSLTVLGFPTSRYYNNVSFFIGSSAPLLTMEEQGELEDRAAGLTSALRAEAPLPSITIWRQLYAAIERGDEATAVGLIHAGADLTIQQYDKHVDKKSTILHIACRNGLESVVHAILSAPGIKFVNALDMDNNTPLILACKHNNVNTIRSLLLAGAKLNERNKYGETALCVACKFKNKEVALVLIQQVGIDINVGNPLSLIEGDDTMAEVTAALLAKGADREAETLYQYGNSSPGASVRQLEAAIVAGDSHTASMLIARGARSSAKGFMFAAMRGWREIALELLKDPELNKNSEFNGETPLSIAVGLNDTDMIRRLFELHVDLNANVGGFQTALYIACRNFKEEAALLLIELGADVNRGDPITMFRGNRMPRVKAALLAAGAKDPLVEGGNRKKQSRKKRQQQRTTRKN
jgi:ankyrin repeat protein